MPHILNNIVIFQKVILQDKDGKILALRRKENDDRRPGAWDLPGGGFEKGEDLVAAIEREVMEETHLIAKDFQILTARSIKGIDAADVDNIFIGWAAKNWSGAISLSDEHIEYRWVTAAEFAELPTWDEQGFLQDLVKLFAHAA